MTLTRKTVIIFRSNWNFGWSLLMSFTRIFDNFVILIQVRDPSKISKSIFCYPFSVSMSLV